MKVAFYAANLQGLTWVKPVHDLVGGTLCTDRAYTFEAAKKLWPQDEIRFFEAGKKWSLRRARGQSKTTVSQREDHVSLAHIARELAPDVIVTTANFPHYIRRGGIGKLRQGGAFSRVKQVQMFHGISSKNNKFKPFMSNYDLLLFVGERDKRRFEQLRVLEQTRWKLIGLPRADKVFRSELSRDKTLRELGLDVSRKTVLYAPTQGALSSFPTWGEGICRAVASSYNLIIKPHPLLAQAAKDGQNSAMWNAVIEYSKSRANTVFLASHADIQTLMNASDLLVTDFSSAAEEWLIFDRPMVFANHLANDNYHLSRGEWDAIHACGEVVTEKDRLLGAIENALNPPSQFADARRAMRDDVFFQPDGNAAQRAAQALRELCEGTL